MAKHLVLLAAALVALVFTACGPRTYGECVEAAWPSPDKPPSDIELTVVSLAGKGAPPGRIARVRQLAKCCELERVYPEDEGLCAKAREVVREIGR